MRSCFQSSKNFKYMNIKSSFKLFESLWFKTTSPTSAKWNRLHTSALCERFVGESRKGLEPGWRGVERGKQPW